MMCRVDGGFVTILSDGAVWDLDEERNEYRVIAFDAKPVLLPHISAALVSLGSGDFLPAMYLSNSQKWTSFDVLLGCVCDDARATFGRLQRIAFPAYRTLRCAIYLAGWSDERRRFETYAVDVDPSGAVSEPEPLPEVVFSPAPGEEALAAVGVLGKGIDPTDNVSLGLHMQAMRLTPGEMGAADPPPVGHMVGGFLQKTILMKDRIYTEILHRWDDKIGEPVIPKPGEVEALKAALTEPIGEAE